MSTITPHVPVFPPAIGPQKPGGIPPAELEAIIRSASDLFGTPVVARLEEDPEIDETYYVLHMAVPHTVDEVSRLRLRWFEMLQQLAPDHCHWVRLSVAYSS